MRLLKAKTVQKVCGCTKAGVVSVLLRLLALLVHAHDTQEVVLLQGLAACQIAKVAHLDELGEAIKVKARVANGA